ncbi:lipoate--protein ligase [Aerococcus christensenii]|nr:lipoate--protein ligase [Aerococcus christensenii]MDK8234284.1 lipoate--protein ligase [Aerococcus christensenii]
MFEDALLIEPIKDGQRVRDTFWLHAMSSYVRESLFPNQSVLMPVVNTPAVEVGKHQNIYQEINMPLIKAAGIKVLRRRAGGGTIYYDQGCLAVWFKLPNDGKGHQYFELVTQPVIEALHSLGATKVKRSGRNDLLIDGKKISGTAVYTTEQYVAGGVSLLLDVDYERMAALLTPSLKKLQSKGIQSVRSRVTDIRSSLNSSYQKITMDEFIKKILCSLCHKTDFEDIPRYHLTSEDWYKIERDHLPAYQDWNWNFGESPTFSYQREHHFSAGSIEFCLEIHQARIEKCRIYGDFFCKGDIHDVEKALIGVSLEAEALKEAFKPLDLSYYFGQVSGQELVDLIVS